MKFVLENNYWWEVKGNKVYNMCGGRHDLDTSLPIVEADDWTSLDWSCLLNRHSTVGWIAPDGTWFGCDHSAHTDVAELFFKTTEEKLEKNGWVKVYRSPLNHMRDWYTKGMVVTRAQADTLNIKGFSVDDFQIKEG